MLVLALALAPFGEGLCLVVVLGIARVRVSRPAWLVWVAVSLEHPTRRRVARAARSHAIRAQR